MIEIKPLKEIQKEHILQVLRSTRGDVESASRILGIKPSVLRRRMKEYGLPIPDGGEERKE